MEGLGLRLDLDVSVSVGFCWGLFDPWMNGRGLGRSGLPCWLVSEANWMVWMVGGADELWTGRRKVD